MTRAPLSAAQRIAAASAASGIVPSGFTTFATSSCEVYAMPTMPCVSRFAAISPAMNVPCPSVSTHGSPPTKLRASSRRPWKSGSEQSTPESTIATLTGSSDRRRLRPRVERVVVLEEPLLRRERVGRRERRRGHRSRENGDGEREQRAAHQRTTTCGDVVPGANPAAGTTETR